MADADLMIAIGHLGDLGAPGPPYYDVDAEKKLHGRQVTSNGNWAVKLRARGAPAECESTIWTPAHTI